LAEWPGFSLAVGILLLVGGFISFIVGMLYKIVPFLAWLHLQNACGGQAPNMNRLLPELAMQRQMKAHAVAVALLLAAVVWPEWLLRPAGAALALAGGWLFYNLWGAVGRYRRHLAQKVSA
jgi:hypothetical protein